MTMVYTAFLSMVLGMIAGFFTWNKYKNIVERVPKLSVTTSIVTFYSPHIIGVISSWFGVVDISLPLILIYGVFSISASYIGIIGIFRWCLKD